MIPAFWLESYIFPLGVSKNITAQILHNASICKQSGQLETLSLWLADLDW